MKKIQDEIALEKATREWVKATFISFSQDEIKEQCSADEFVEKTPSANAEKPTTFPKWQTMWRFGSIFDNITLEEDDRHLQAFADCGFRVYWHYDYFCTFGIDVDNEENYDFYKSHWIPLYKALVLDMARNVDVNNSKTKTKK